VEDISTWYLRRSRDRIKDGDKDAKQALYFILKTVAKVLAPLAPFSAEDMWMHLKNEKDVESVHLTNWPTEPFKLFSFGNSKILKEMEQVREIVTFGLEARQKAGIKVRQPLKKLEVKNFDFESDYIELIKDELNVKEILPNKNIEADILLDITIDSELKQEGDYRDLVRALQDMRKDAGLTPNNVIALVFETNDAGKNLIQKFEADMKKTVLVSQVEFKDNDGDEVKIGEIVFKVKIQK
jgi:isoleucyl-tRNA synthetase